MRVLRPKKPPPSRLSPQGSHQPPAPLAATTSTPIHHAPALPCPAPTASLTRREVSGGWSRRVLLSVALAALWPRHPALAGPPVRGAAELDAEYYIRGLLGQPPPQVEQVRPEPARELDRAYALAALGVCETQIASALGSTSSQLRVAAGGRQPRLRMEMERTLVSGAFGRGGYEASTTKQRNGGSGSSDDTADGDASVPLSELEFDLRLCALFSLVADARLPQRRLDDFYRRLGDELLRRLHRDTRPAATALSETCAGCAELLRSLVAVGYLADFSFDDADADDGLWARGGELGVTRLSVVLIRPASLRGALLLNSQGGSVSSELAAPLLSAYLRAHGAVVRDSSEFFVDEYRPNPFEYRPSQMLLELTVAPAG